MILVPPPPSCHPSTLVLLDLSECHGSAADSPFLAEQRVFPSICYDVRSVLCSASRKEKIMTAAHFLQFRARSLALTLSAASDVFRFFVLPRVFKLTGG